MLLFVKRSLVISSALLSIGLFGSEEIVQHVAAEEQHKLQTEKTLIEKANETNYDLFEAVLPAKAEHYIHRSKQSAQYLHSYIVKQAYEQGIAKFGENTTAKIGADYKREILPKFKNALIETTASLSDDEWKYLQITHDPASGFGEKILHLYNDDTKEDILRLHVRRDHPPNKGYYFNFHYHTYADNFEKHHDLGTIYWGKDIPQKWTS